MPFITSLLAPAILFSATPSMPQGPGLRELANRQMLTLGTATPVRLIRDDADGGKYRSTLVANFNMIELENEFKPPAVWSGPREFKFTDTDFILGAPGQEGWAQKNQLKVRGHVLVYASDPGYTLPDWLRKDESKLSKEEAKELLHNYINTVVTRYKGKVAMWDVVNEAIDDRPNKNPFNLRDSLWFRKLGPEFLILAFQWAREADPKAELYYNDYGVESGNTKGQHMLDLVKWLKEKGAPITGVGLQYHIGHETVIEPSGPYYRYLESIEALGLDHMVTELDVAVPTKELPNGDPNRGLIGLDPADFNKQAKVYADVFRMAMSMRRCRGINIWGLNDKYSWIPMISRGRTGLALLFAPDYKAKPAYAAIEAVLKR